MGLPNESTLPGEGDTGATQSDAAPGPNAGSLDQQSAPEGAEWNAEMEAERRAAADRDRAAKYLGHEIELLERMRGAAEAAGVPAQDADDATLMRFLRARGMDVPKASKLFLDDVSWRRDYLGGPGGRISPADVAGEMRSNKAYIVAKDGLRPWVFLFARNHDTATRDMDTFKRFAVFVVEETIRCFPPGEEKFGAVLDLGESQYRNLDARGMIAIFDTLQAHYPERLHRLFLIHVPYVFWAVWRAIKPLIDPRTRQKIQFVEDSELRRVLGEEVPSAVLPVEYGGTAVLKGLWDLYGEKSP